MLISTNEFEKNRVYVSQELNFNRLLEILIEIRNFLNDLGDFSIERNILVFRKIGIVNSNIILNSATKTIESIRYCCINANLADAYTLLRKFRDDLFYYIYLFAVANNSDFTQCMNINALSKDEKNIWDWMYNKQNNLYIGFILKYIASQSSIKTLIKDFNLNASFDKLANKLNNYVHSNGYIFYNESADKMMQRKKVKEKCDEFGEVAIFITITFLFLITLINPLFIMSYDYSDFLDMGAIPPEDSQYWVAPFISEFLFKYKYILDENCVNYLKEKTGMQI